jgi:hypothetical protein
VHRLPGFAISLKKEHDFPLAIKTSALHGSAFLILCNSGADQVQVVAVMLFLVGGFEPTCDSSIIAHDFVS